MTHFLYRPHVYGPDNNVTSPDILIDKAYMADGLGNALQISNVAVNKLSSQVELEVDVDELMITPAYVLIAAGGGVLLSVGAHVKSAVDGEALSNILLTRYTWRLRNISEHAGTLELNILRGPVADERREAKITINKLSEPQKVVSRVSQVAQALPRGTLLFCPAPSLTQPGSVPDSVEIRLEDAKLGRRLIQRADFVTVEYDPWEQRPLPRYTVGPTAEEVKHYI